MTTLREAAQAEPVQEPVWVCPDSAEHRYQKPGHCEDCGKTLVQVAEPVQQGCEHCNQPLYAAIKCRVCGRETAIIEPEITGDNKPVAWLHVPHPCNGMSPIVSLSQQREPSLYGASVPLFLKE